MCGAYSKDLERVLPEEVLTAPLDERVESRDDPYSSHQRLQGQENHAVLKGSNQLETRDDRDQSRNQKSLEAATWLELTSGVGIS